MTMPEAFDIVARIMAEEALPEQYSGEVVNDIISIAEYRYDQWLQDLQRAYVEALSAKEGETN